MKILIITGHFYPEGESGQSKFVKTLSESIIKKDNEVKILAISKSYNGMDNKIGDIFYKEYIFGISNVFSIRPKSLCSPYVLKVKDYVEDFTEIIKSLSPDIIHFIPFNYMCEFISIAIELKIPYIITSVDGYLYCSKKFMLLSNTDYCEHSHKGAYCKQNCNELGIDFQQRYKDAKQMVENSKMLVTPSKFLANRYIREFNIDNVYVMNHGLEETGVFQNNRIYKKNDTITFGYTGNLGMLKGLNILIMAFNKLNHIHNIKLKIYGGEYCEDLFKLIKNNDCIEFMGSYNLENIEAVYASIDILICPSLYYETFSYVTKEAMQRKIPVIATNAGGMSEMIINFYNGIKFERGNYLELSAIIELISKNPEIINTLKQNIVHDSMSLEHEMEFYNGLYQKILLNEKIDTLKFTENQQDLWRLLIEQLNGNSKINIDFEIFEQFTKDFCDKHSADNIDIKALYIKLLYFDYHNIGKKINYVLWGASVSGIMTYKFIAEAFPSYKISCFFDAYKKGEVNGIPIKHTDFADNEDFNLLLICTDAGRKQASNKMNQLGFAFLKDYFYGYKI